MQNAINNNAAAETVNGSNIVDVAFLVSNQVYTIENQQFLYKYKQQTIVENDSLLSTILSFHFPTNNNGQHFGQQL